MTIIETEMLRAFVDERDWRMRNTRVKVDAYSVRVYLHNNLICVKDRSNGAVYYSHAGWMTQTTKSRLNALGAYIYQRHGVWYHFYTNEPFVDTDLYMQMAYIRRKYLESRDTNLFVA